jgi:hypothetical protein
VPRVTLEDKQRIELDIGRVNPLGDWGALSAARRH